MPHKPIISLDFDGVIHSYTSGGKWDPAVVRDPPTPGALDALTEYLTHFDVQVFSSRSHQPGGAEAMQNWCELHFGRQLTRSLGWPLHKPPALLTLDDRALTFTGRWPTIEEIKAFRPWNRK